MKICPKYFFEAGRIRVNIRPVYKNGIGGIQKWCCTYPMYTTYPMYRTGTKVQPSRFAGRPYINTSLILTFTLMPWYRVAFAIDDRGADITRVRQPQNCVVLTTSMTS